MSDNTRLKHSQPISIPASSAHGRPRSGSSSSDDSNNSPPLTTPVSANSPPKVTTSPSSSPILSYFFASSPTKTGPVPTTFGRPLGVPPVATADHEHDDHDPMDSSEGRMAAHARRMSASWAAAATTPRFSQTLKSNPMPTTDAAQERGAGLLRRLSLSSAFVRPVIPTGTAAPRVPPSPATARRESPPRAPPSPPAAQKTRRAATLSIPNGDSRRPRRAPSPMGERILKGHFDGFN